MIVHTSARRTAAGVPAAQTYDGPAELPRLTVDTTFPTVTGSTRTVSNQSEWDTEIAAAVGGDEIVLDTSFTGTLTLPNRTYGDSRDGWILIRSDNAAWQSASTTRITATTNMRTVTAPSSVEGYPALKTGGNASHHYYICGVSFAASASNFTYSLITIGEGETVLANVPEYIIFDRCYFAGDATLGARRAMAMNGANVAVINSYLKDFKENGSDSQAIMAWNAPGPLLIHNNYLEGSAENVMFGGVDPSISNLIPSDITITSNHFNKPSAWDALTWDEKNLLEFKNAQRVLVEKNYMCRIPAKDQDGFAIVITPRNQNNTAPWSTTRDITIRNNWLTEVGSAFIIAGSDTDGPTSDQTYRISIHDNVIEMGNGSVSPANMYALQTSAGPENVHIEHNTILNMVGTGGRVTYFYDNAIKDGADLVIQDNIVSWGAYGIWGESGLDGTNALNTHWSSWTCEDNVFLGGVVTNNPAGNYWPGVITSLFTDYANADYSLSGSSGYEDAASDGADIGVSNFAAVLAYKNAAIAG